MAASRIPGYVPWGYSYVRTSSNSPVETYWFSTNRGKSADYWLFPSLSLHLRGEREDVHVPEYHSWICCRISWPDATSRLILLHALPVLSLQIFSYLPSTNQTLLERLSMKSICMIYMSYGVLGSIYSNMLLCLETKLWFFRPTSCLSFGLQQLKQGNIRRIPNSWVWLLSVSYPNTWLR